MNQANWCWYNLLEKPILGLLLLITVILGTGMNAIPILGWFYFAVSITFTRSFNKWWLMPFIFYAIFFTGNVATYLRQFHYSPAHIKQDDVQKIVEFIKYMSAILTLPYTIDNLLRCYVPTNILHLSLLKSLVFPSLWTLAWYIMGDSLFTASWGFQAFTQADEPFVTDYILPVIGIYGVEFIMAWTGTLISHVFLTSKYRLPHRHEYLFNKIQNIILASPAQLKNQIVEKYNLSLPDLTPSPMDVDVLRISVSVPKTETFTIEHPDFIKSKLTEIMTAVNRAEQCRREAQEATKRKADLDQVKHLIIDGDDTNQEALLEPRNSSAIQNEEALDVDSLKIARNFTRIVKMVDSIEKERQIASDNNQNVYKLPVYFLLSFLALIFVLAAHYRFSVVNGGIYQPRSPRINSMDIQFVCLQRGGPTPEKTVQIAQQAVEEIVQGSDTQSMTKLSSQPLVVVLFAEQAFSIASPEQEKVLFDTTTSEILAKYPKTVVGYAYNYKLGTEERSKLTKPGLRDEQIYYNRLAIMTPWSEKKAHVINKLVPAPNVEKKTIFGNPNQTMYISNDSFRPDKVDHYRDSADDAELIKETLFAGISGIFGAICFDLDWPSTWKALGATQSPSPLLLNPAATWGSLHFQTLHATKQEMIAKSYGATLLRCAQDGVSIAASNFDLHGGSNRGFVHRFTRKWKAQVSRPLPVQTRMLSKKDSIYLDRNVDLGMDEKEKTLLLDNEERKLSEMVDFENAGTYYRAIAFMEGYVIGVVAILAFGWVLYFEYVADLMEGSVDENGNKEDSVMNNQLDNGTMQEVDEEQEEEGGGEDDEE